MEGEAPIQGASPARPRLGLARPGIRVISEAPDLDVSSGLAQPEFLGGVRVKGILVHAIVICPRSQRPALTHPSRTGVGERERGIRRPFPSRSATILYPNISIMPCFHSS